MDRFQRLDVRPVLKRGGEPLADILARIAALEPGDGLVVIAPFLPSPLIELLGGKGFASRIERGEDGSWIVYFWHENENQ